MQIQLLDAATPAARHLLALSDSYMNTLYPAESNHLEGVSALQQPNVHFIGGYVNDELVACGAVKLMDDDGIYGEIKRVFVLEAHRGKGYSRRVMESLEQHLREKGVHIARLETGIRQPEALGLYRKLGYTECGPYGAYRPDPLSVFMEKLVAAVH
jgi:putative acetyltransferase